MLSALNSLLAIFKKLSTIGKDSFTVMKERAVLIHAPVFLAEKLQSIMSYSNYNLQEIESAHHARNEIFAVL